MEIWGVMGTSFSMQNSSWIFFLAWGLSSTYQVAQRGCGIFITGDTQNTSGSEQPDVIRPSTNATNNVHIHKKCFSGIVFLLQYKENEWIFSRLLVLFLHHDSHPNIPLSWEGHIAIFHSESYTDYGERCSPERWGCLWRLSHLTVKLVSWLSEPCANKMLSEGG